MALIIGEHTIERVGIVDDDPDGRWGFSYPVVDMGLIPVPAEDPKYTDLDEFVDLIRSKAQAAICDYMLTAKNYAAFTGGEAVAKLYQREFPAILCTRYSKAEVDIIRQLRRYIPVLLTPDELEPTAIEMGFNQCIAEFNGQFQASRHPRSTLVRIEDRDKEKGYCYMIVPAWNPNEIISIRLEHLAIAVQSKIEAGQQHFHAQVNLGAEVYQDLYLTDWELD